METAWLIELKQSVSRTPTWYGETDEAALGREAQGRVWQPAQSRNSRLPTESPSSPYFLADSASVLGSVNYGNFPQFDRKKR